MIASYDTEPWFPFAMAAVVMLIAFCSWMIGRWLAPSVHRWLIEGGDERYALREKATVTFVVEHGHEDQAVLLDAALVDGVITGRWQPDLRGDEGWYSFPLYRVKQILWEEMSDDD